jgi:hypothetical protein
MRQNQLVTSFNISISQKQMHAIKIMECMDGKVADGIGINTISQNII